MGGKTPRGAPPKAFDRGAADKEFQRARDQARDFNKGGDKNRGGGREVENWRPDGAKKFDDVRSGRKERTLFGGKRRDIIEPDNRVIVRQNDRSFIRHDESNRFKRTGREVRRDRRKDGESAFFHYRCRFHRRVAFHHHPSHHEGKRQQNHDGRDEDGADAVCRDKAAQHRADRHAAQ